MREREREYRGKTFLDFFLIKYKNKFNDFMGQLELILVIDK